MWLSFLLFSDYKREQSIKKASNSQSSISILHTLSAPDSRMTDKENSIKSLNIGITLRKDNYPLWSYSIIPMLVDEKLVIVTTDETTNIKTVQLKNNDRSLRALLVNISESLTTEIIHCETAQKVWDFFYSAHSGTSYVRQCQGIHKPLPFALCIYRDQDFAMGISLVIVSLRCAPP